MRLLLATQIDWTAIHLSTGIKYMNITDGQTDIRHTATEAALCIALRQKKWKSAFEFLTRVNTGITSQKRCASKPSASSRSCRAIEAVVAEWLGNFHRRVCSVVWKQTLNGSRHGIEPFGKLLSSRTRVPEHTSASIDFIALGYRRTSSGITRFAKYAVFARA